MFERDYDVYDFENDCAEVMLSNGLVPPTPFITDGKLHRCGTLDKPHGTDGAYIVHEANASTNSAAVLWWENHKTGISDTFMGQRPYAQNPATNYVPNSVSHSDLNSVSHSDLNSVSNSDPNSVSHSDPNSVPNSVSNSDPNSVSHSAAAIAQRQEAHLAEQEAAYAEAAARAKDIWSCATPTDKHPYLQKKGVPTNTLRQTEDGRLIIPVQTTNNDSSISIQSLQFIDADGQKRFLAGGKKAGGFYPIQATKDESDVLCICEGYATGLSINMATGHYCLVAFDAGNLLPVAKLLRAQCPDWEIVVCADNDVKTSCDNDVKTSQPTGDNDVKTSCNNDVKTPQPTGDKAMKTPQPTDDPTDTPTGPNDSTGEAPSQFLPTAPNVGIQKALEAAMAISASIAIPPAHEGRATDFNDLHQARGLDAVAACIDAAMPALDYANILVHTNSTASPSISPISPTSASKVGKIVKIAGVGAQKVYPLRKKTAPQPPYPVEALGDYAEAALAIAEHAGAPLSMVGNAVLSMLSLAAQDIAIIEHEGRKILPSLYLLSILGSGERKSTVNDVVMEGIDVHQESLTMEYNEKMKEWRIDDHAYNAAKIRASKGKDYATIRTQLQELGDAPARPVEPRLKITNANIEGLYRMFQEGSDSLGLIADEGGILFGGTAFSSENKLKTIATLSSLWSSGSSDKVRMGEGSSYVHNKRLTCHLMVQPIVIEPLFADRVMQEQGFLPRFLITWPESLKGTRFKTLGKKQPLGQHSAVRKMHQDCLRLLQFPRAIDGYGKRRYIDLPLSPEAEELYIDLYNRVEAAQAPDGELCDVANFASRTAEQALRIAGVLSLAKDPRAASIGGDVMHRAASLSTWYTYEAKRIMESNSVQPEVLQAEALLRWFESKELTLTTQAFILRNTKFRSVVELKKVLSLLEDHGYVAPMPQGTIVHGKPSNRAWRVLHYTPQE